MSFNTLECFADLPDLFSADSEAMIAATARHREISSLEFSSTSLEPTGKSEFSKSARFGYERAEHYDNRSAEIFITSHGELIAPRGISMCKPAPVRLADEIFLFPRCRETLNTLIYRRSYGATFIGKHCSIRDSRHAFSNSRYDESDVRLFLRYFFFERGKSRRKFINTTKISDHLRY